MEINLPVSALPQSPVQPQVSADFSLRNQNPLGQGQTSQNGDFLSMIFQQMECNPNLSSNAILPVEQTKDNEMLQLLKKQLDEDGTELSMQMAAEILNSTVGLNHLILQQIKNPAECEQKVELLRIATDGKDKSILMQNDIVSESNSAILDVNKKTVEFSAFSDAVKTSQMGKPENAQIAKEIPSALQTNQVAELELSENKPLRTARSEAKTVQAIELSEVNTKSAETPKTELLTAQNQLERNVKSVLKSIKTAESTSKEDIDIEKMQKEVKAGVHLSGQMPEMHSTNLSSLEKVKEPQSDAPVDFLKQVETGIKTGLQTGKNEFTFKLKPEGLGEITVKMVEESGKIALNIIASTARVEKLLNGELASLQQSLKPYNVEVQPAITQPSATSNYSAMNYGHNFSQQQSNQQSQSGNELTWQSSRQSENVKDSELQEVLTKIEVSQKKSGLDTYI